MVGALMDKIILRQVLSNLFSFRTSQETTEYFISVSFLQFYPDGAAVDLVSPNKETLQLVTHPVIGRCSSLFSVTAEWKIHPEQVESDVCRSKLQLFSLAGGASKTDLRGLTNISRFGFRVIPLLKVLDQTLNPPAVSDSLLHALLKDALTGNNRTFLIYCINSQGFLDDETQSALHLAQKVRGLVTKPTSVHWNPRSAEQELRESIMELQNLILLGEKGKGSADKVQERVTRIQQLKEALREETLKNETVPGKSQLSQQSQSEYNEAQERRRQLKEDHTRLIQEEVAKMERDLAQEQPPTESPQRELLVLSRERQVLVMHIEALRAEAQQAESDLQDQHHRHQTELHCLREESLQVFRVFRQVSEEQRKISEGRYRSVLLEAVQDATYLSAQNQQLQAENKQLRKALGEIKDALAVRGDPVADLINQQR
ncbi:hypothetical protein CRENBAI_016897 [Crenichthys baileyi]|uniref:Uncharacterized protein n=1 Tax=Crenichthys baileyi TaxID=28760 RepID=A0AAV9RQU8_9TELE